MNPADLTPGIHAVTHPGYAPNYQTLHFNLSVVKDCGVTAVAGFLPGQKPPKRGKHLLLTDSVRNWIEEMTFARQMPTLRDRQRAHSGGVG